MNNILYYRPEIVAFFSGVLVMVFEILGARVVGPYIGTSLFVWTSLIAVILFALSLGAYYGGKIADRRADLLLVSTIFLLSAFSIFILIITKNFFLEFVSSSISDVRLSSLIIAIVLFAPTSFFLGLIGPIVTKIRMHDIKTGGSVVGKISSIGTIGSIIGTLGAGFFLIPIFGVSSLLIILGVICVILSLLCDYKKLLFLQILCISAFYISYISSSIKKQVEEELGTYQFDTSYSHVIISDRIEDNIRDLYIDNVTHAGMYLDGNELAYEYTKYYHLFDALNSNAQNVLMLGGAAYSFPKSFLEKYPGKMLDVVEIDSGLTELAKRFFRLEDTAKLNIHHQDARTFLNQSQKKYDAILGDAFGSYYSIPYQLTTQEVVQKKYDMLSENGVVILNIISSIAGKNASFLESEYLTYSSIFPEVFIVPVKSMNKNDAQNIMLIALKNPEVFPEEVLNPLYASYLSKKTYLDIAEYTTILTDDYAPVDYMVAKMNID